MGAVTSVKTQVELGADQRSFERFQVGLGLQDFHYYGFPAVRSRWRLSTQAFGALLITCCLFKRASALRMSAFSRLTSAAKARLSMV